MDEKNSAYLKLIMEKGEKLRMPGIIKLLEKLKKSGMKTALASGSGNARKIMTAAKIPENRFDAIITGKDFKNSKPHPESFLKAAAEINVPPRACLVVEDAPAGIEAAREAGMGTFGIGTAQLGPCDITQKKLNSKSDWLIFEYFQQKSRLSRSSET
jgi:HAD superfamily hydrolase (TIGR01509 family)